MNSLSIGILFNHSIIIAAVIAIVRFKKIKNLYYPFLAVLMLGLINETLSVFCIYTHRSNTANSNVYVLVEYLLILWQFYRWNHSPKERYHVLAFTGLIIWTADNFILHHLTANNSLARVFFSMTIAMLGVNQLSKLLFFGEAPLWKNGIFIICTGFVMFFGFKAFVETFNIFRQAFSIPFLSGIWIILYFVNLITNLLYAAAMIWIPGKQKFIWRY